ncbi:DNA-processing protein DprA [Bacillus ndiopicus]|uniref:DNA-processing protein DprA n=1 Tax=Bacillus ndiopicus TaxID=1347368 RepID=UPI000693CC2B|nr:DNA-processing protein DprA [Bacillus ndiopicus]
MNNLFWLTFSCIKGVGNIAVKELYFQHPYTDFNLINNRSFLQTLKPSIKKYLLDEESIQQAREKALNILELQRINEIEVITIDSEYYPISLRFIKDPPAILYAKGNIELLKDLDMVAVVGTREPTPTGENSSRKIAATFAEMGYTIVSGLALGIDTAGHEGALRVKEGRTIAVLAGDLSKIYPAKNKNLAEKIIKNRGLLLSETGIGQPVGKGSFVKRDRIQSGLSLGVCPVQTPIKSGTQHTIQFTREQKRILFTPVVLEVDKEQVASQGNLELIKEDGVIVLNQPEDYKIIILKMGEIKEQFLNYTEKLKSKKIPRVFETTLYDQGTLF